MLKLASSKLVLTEFYKFCVKYQEVTCFFSPFPVLQVESGARPGQDAGRSRSRAPGDGDCQTGGE